MTVGVPALVDPFDFLFPNTGHMVNEARCYWGKIVARGKDWEARREAAALKYR